MKMSAPFSISSRLMTSIKIGSENVAVFKQAILSVEYGKQDKEGRQGYTVWLDIGDKEHELTGFKSGCQGGTIRDGFILVLDFMSAAAESFRHSMGGRKSENADMFPPEVMEWCYMNDIEIQMAKEEIEANEGALVED